MQTTCPKCSHNWEYTGKAWWITCPVCRKLFKNPDTHGKAQKVKK